MLERVEYRVARTAAAREEIFQLRYRGYTKNGVIKANESGRFSDSWDDVSNALLLGVYLGGALASTVRIHVSSPGLGDAPAFEPFADVLTPLAEAGQRFIDPTRFVIDEDFARAGPEMPFLTLRLTCMAAEHFDACGILATVRQNHAAIYKRVCGHRAISEARTYPLLRKPIVCMLAETDTIRRLTYSRHPFLVSTEEERSRLFGPVSKDASATVH